jgi:hypothetical protein
VLVAIAVAVGFLRAGAPEPAEPLPGADSQQTGMRVVIGCGGCAGARSLATATRRTT